MNRIFKISLAAMLAASTLAISVGDASAMSKNKYCRNYAAGQANKFKGNSVGSGALLGAGAGGLYGGITGNGAGSNIVTGLALGAIGGAIVGGASGSQKAKNVYWAAYHDCMDS